MIRLVIYIILSFMGIILLPACDVEGELEICPYNVRLDYFYSRYGTQRNELTGYLNYHCQYLFDAEGLLLDTIPLRGKAMQQGEFDLAPGRYTVMCWANRDSTNRIDEPVIGTTTLRDLTLAIDHAYVTNDETPAPPSGYEWQADCAPLYYAYADFEVIAGKIIRRRVDFVSAHCRLTIKVRWKDRAPDNTGNFVMTLRNVPSRVGSEPEFTLDALPESMVYNIPTVYLSPMVNHAAPATMDITREINGRIICNRLRDSNHPLLGLYAGQKPLLNDIDLQRYFRAMGTHLDTNLLQDFSLLIEIDKDGNATIRPLGNNDWIDGGTIGSGF